MDGAGDGNVVHSLKLPSLSFAEFDRFDDCTTNNVLNRTCRNRVYDISESNNML